MQKAKFSNAGLYCILAYSITWLWWGMRFMSVLADEKSITRTSLGPFDVQIGMFGPLLAALVMRLFISKEGWRNSLGPNCSWTVYLSAYLIPTVLGIIAIVVNNLLGIAYFRWAGDTRVTLSLKMGLITILASLTAIGEEYGWRGYLLPRLMPLGEARASFFTGLIWGLWHLPLLLVGLSYPGQPIGLAIPVFVFSTIMFSFIFTRFHILSNGSVVVAALIHGALNALTELTSPPHLVGGNNLITDPFGLTTSILLLVIIFLFYTSHIVYRFQNQIRRPS